MGPINDVLEYPGLFGTIWDCLVQSGISWEYLGISHIIRDYHGLSGTILDYVGLSGTIWAYLGKCVYVIDERTPVSAYRLLIGCFLAQAMSK